MNKKSFRSDINGLRGLAVLVVVFYHFGVPGFSGGFIGVDVFFVISGFLMTSIIMKNLDEGRLSLSGFYLDRMKRIVPALTALILILILMGAILLAPLDYERFSKYAASSILFVSNITYGLENGYFSISAHRNWLLHTWSLSVEWQFYFLYPIFLILLKRNIKSVKFFNASIAATFFASLALSIIVTPYKPTAAFYILPTRAWELLAGAIIYIYFGKTEVKKTHAMMMEIVGLIMIGCAVFAFSGESRWPGYYACLPVLGAALLILSNHNQSLIGKSYIFQLLGNSSYSIYLFHWPIVVIGEYTGINNFAYWTVIGVFASVLVGYISLNLIEIPFRKKKIDSDTTREIRNFSLIVITIVLTGLLIIYKDGYPSRANEHVRIIEENERNINPRRNECTVESGTETPGCIYGGEEIKLIVLGDSHADSVVNAIAAALPSSKAGLVYMGYAGCPTMRSVDRVGDENWKIQCSRYNEKILKEIENDVPVLVVSRYSVYAIGNNDNKTIKPYIYIHGMENKNNTSVDFSKEFSKKLVETACEISKRRQLYMALPIPEMGFNVPYVMKRRAMLDQGNKPDIGINYASYLERNKIVINALKDAEKRCGVVLLNPAEYLCEGGFCKGALHNIPLYYDSNHLNEFGNRLLTPMFKKIFTN